MSFRWHQDVLITPGSGADDLTVRGDLDVAAIAPVRGELTARVRSGCPRVVLDMTGARLVDRPTVELFATMMRQLDGAGCSVILAGLSPLQEAMLRTYGVERFASADRAGSVLTG